MTSSFLSRRILLVRGALIAAAAGLHTLVAPPAGADTSAAKARLRAAIARLRAREDRVLTGRLSVNGWEMERLVDDHGNIHTRSVTGTPVEVPVRLGDVEAVLAHVVRSFHAQVDELHAGDVGGWRAPAAVRAREPESNLASGTAVRIRPGHYPPGVRGGFFAPQEEAVRGILAGLDGVVHWGGDDRQVDESRFSIDVPPGDPRLAAVAARLRL